MDKFFYQTPAVKIMSVYSEGILCTSDSEEEDAPMILPGTSWKDEVIL